MGSRAHSCTQNVRPVYTLDPLFHLFAAHNYYLDRCCWPRSPIPFGFFSRCGRDAPRNEEVASRAKWSRDSLARTSSWVFDSRAAQQPPLIQESVLECWSLKKGVPQMTSHQVVLILCTFFIVHRAWRVDGGRIESVGFENLLRWHQHCGCGNDGAYRPFRTCFLPTRARTSFSYQPRYTLIPVMVSKITWEQPQI